jgi:cytochrome c6
VAAGSTAGRANHRTALAAAAAAGAAGVFVLSGGAASGRTVSQSATATVITVRAGSPSTYSFSLSKSVGLTTGSFTFHVTVAGKAHADFKVCTKPVAGAATDSCAGVATKVLKPGQSASLTVTLPRTGLYEYLSSVPGQAARGMKGLLAVSLTAGSPTTTVSSTGTNSDVTTVPQGTTCVGRCAPPPVSTTPATKPPATETLVGNPTAGAALFVANCGSCHTLAAAGTNSDVGPNLDSYAPLQETLIGYMEYGSDSMPAFGGALSGDQIDNIAAYVYSSTHAAN